ncbi:LysR substrate-binding domain-containing protein [Pseudomonas japonica]|uniref:Transcriptional regulator, LysR family n=1 Tax=Pseudomonas japonica TaxID=256466 RepID=A0A239LAG5_9PSED|nr:LysR substrate-binding domain-containing protein [Pseudomonas japonica]SNT27616.1 transcriptional regulator, LysR family [Pseudomonas japonica]
MIELRQLRYFLALAEHLHFGKAAASLNLAQPSLSRQISSLEEAMGCALVLRSSRAVSLTAAGRELQRNAGQVLAGLESAIRASQAVARGERGELRIAFTSMVAWTDFPRLIKAFSQAWPGVGLSLHELMPMELERSVLEGNNDVCLSFRQAGHEALRYQALHSEPLCIALPADHRLARRRDLRLDELSAEPFILVPRNTAPVLYDNIMAQCQAAGFDPQVRLYTQLQGTIVNLVAEGLGVSLVPSAMARSNLPGIRFFALADSPRIEFGISWHPDNGNPCLESFLQMMCQSAD